MKVSCGLQNWLYFNAGGSRSFLRFANLPIGAYSLMQISDHHLFAKNMRHQKDRAVMRSI